MPSRRLVFEQQKRIKLPVHWDKSDSFIGLTPAEEENGKAHWTLGPRPRGGHAGRGQTLGWGGVGGMTTLPYLSGLLQGTE